VGTGGAGTRQNVTGIAQAGQAYLCGGDLAVAKDLSDERPDEGSPLIGWEAKLNLLLAVPHGKDVGTVRYEQAMLLWCCKQVPSISQEHADEDCPAILQQATGAMALAMTL
jgi:hypothetical protein